MAGLDCRVDHMPDLPCRRVAEAVRTVQEVAACPIAYANSTDDLVVLALSTNHHENPYASILMRARRMHTALSKKALRSRYVQ